MASKKRTRKAKAKARPAVQTAGQESGPSVKAEQATVETVPTVTSARSGLVNVPNSGTGKAIRRLLRKAGIYLSKDPTIGKAECSVEDGTCSVTVHGQTFSTAVRG